MSERDRFGKGVRVHVDKDTDGRTVNKPGKIVDFIDVGVSARQLTVELDVGGRVKTTIEYGYSRTI